jgi:hypothetical protein
LPPGSRADFSLQTRKDLQFELESTTNAAKSGNGRSPYRRDAEIRPAPWGERFDGGGAMGGRGAAPDFHARTRPNFCWVRSPIRYRGRKIRLERGRPPGNIDRVSFLTVYGKANRFLESLVKRQNAIVCLKGTAPNPCGFVAGFLSFF